MIFGYKRGRSVRPETAAETTSKQALKQWSTLTEEREVGWSRQHSSRTGPSRWRGCNHCSLNMCNKIWQTGEWPAPWTQSLIITFPEKGNQQLCQNYRTVSLICHLSKVMLKIILNRLKPQAEKIIAEEQAGFRAGRSTTEQIFILRILCDKYLRTSKTSTMSS